MIIGPFVLGGSVHNHHTCIDQPEFNIDSYSPKGRKSRLSELENKSSGFVFISYSSISVLFHRKWNVYMLALFFWKKFIPDLFLLLCKTKTAGNLRKLKKYAFSLISLQARKLMGSPGSLGELPVTPLEDSGPQHRCSDPSQGGVSQPESTWLSQRTVSFTLHSWHPEALIYFSFTFFPLLNILFPGSFVYFHVWPSLSL